MTRVFDRFAAAASKIVGRPVAFLCAAVLILGWLAAGPFFHWSDSHSLFINTITTIITFLMCFLIQATQNRDAAALHAKLDELVRVTAAARNDLIGAEALPAEEIEELRQ